MLSFLRPKLVQQQQRIAAAASIVTPSSVHVTGASVYSNPYSSPKIFYNSFFNSFADTTSSYHRFYATDASESTNSDKNSRNHSNNSSNYNHSNDYSSVGPIQKIMEEKLRRDLKPTTLELINESPQHRYHAGNPDPTQEESHFRLRIVSPTFKGMTLLDQHRLIYKILAEEMDIIHALTIDASAPDDE